MKRLLFLLGVHWRSGRQWYVYNWNFHYTQLPWYKLWHRSKIIRDCYSAVYRWRLRRTARFIVGRKLFWNIEDDKRWRNLL